MTCWRSVAVCARVGAAAIAVAVSSVGAQEQSQPARQPSAGLPAFSPDGRQIAFSYRSPDAPSQLHVIDADGSNERELTSGPESVMDIKYDRGGRLLYRSGVLPGRGDSGQPAAPARMEMHYSVITSGGGKASVIASGPLLGAAAWSPDGRRVVVTTRVGTGPTAITSAFIVDADGQNRRELVSGLPSMQLPAWSPDGHLSFAVPADTGFTLVIADRDGNGRKSLVPNGPAFQSDPAWSPDGKKIVFKGADTRPSRGGDGNRLYVVNSDGTGLKQILANAAEVQRPTFSPDGSQILFVDNRDKNTDLYVMRTDGSNERRLTTDPAFDEWPSWSPDGRTLLFQRSFGNSSGSGIFVMSPDGSNERRLR